MNLEEKVKELEERIVELEKELKDSGELIEALQAACAGRLG
jgi:peptidoglycan hydrolase CwlO-like protein